ncbi:MAG: hypothetical protein NZ483_02335 [Verrucomicrobiae bacterium]|nr:hypothetical protein [Verrucomicrobiae bacterium]
MNFDPKAFGSENDLCVGKPFRTDKPRALICFWLDDHWLCEEMQLACTVRHYRDSAYLTEVHRAWADRCEVASGHRFYRQTHEPPRVQLIEQVLGTQTITLEGGRPSLKAGATTRDELRRQLHELARLSNVELNAVNLGSCIPAEVIRGTYPITGEVRQDFTGVLADGGVTVCTAGSVAAVVSLDRIQTFTAAIQEFCR